MCAFYIFDKRIVTVYLFIFTRLVHYFHLFIAGIFSDSASVSIRYFFTNLANVLSYNVDVFAFFKISNI